MRTHYDTLHIAETATPEEVKAAYRSLAQKWHPDKNPEDREAAERAFCLLNDAYAILSDDRKRRPYDDALRKQRSGVRRQPYHSTEEREPERPLTVGVLLAERYRDEGDGMVVDIRTQLQWLRFALGQRWAYGDCEGEAIEYTWEGAFEAAKDFNAEGHAGFHDWRLPTKQELQTLIYCSNGEPQTWNETGCPCEGDCASPTVHEMAFPHTPAEWFWSATTYDHDAGYAWFVYFSLGGVYAGKKVHQKYVRLVRNVSLWEEE